MCYDGHWKSVCDDSADNVIASAVCKEVGHAGHGWEIYIHILNLLCLHHHIFYCRPGVQSR